MKKIQKIISGVAVIFAIIILQLPFTSTAASAARVYIERAGDFGIKILIDSGEPVNAYDVRVTYDPSVVAVDSVDASQSIVTVLPQPIKTVGGNIVIKGGSTTPFVGTGGELLSFSLKPVRTGDSLFAVEKGTVYLADGKGTSVAVATGDLPITVTENSFTAYERAQFATEGRSGDAVPPKIIVAEVTENPLNYGERLLVFQANDPESGVSHYEARDRQWLAWSDWRQAINPYPLDSGAWAVQLKAIDNSGNEALATVYQFGNAIWKAALVIVLLGMFVGGLFTIRRRRSEV